MYEGIDYIMKKKLVLIGAGSSMFTQGIVLDLIENPGKYKWELALVDIDSEVLESITKLVKKMVVAKNADVEILSSTDRCDVLTGADYVFSTIGVGGRRAWEQDVFIPRKYGINQPVWRYCNARWNFKSDENDSSHDRYY